MSLVKALFNIQGKVSRLPKNSQGHGYKYLDLAGLMDAIIPFAQAEGLLIRQVLSTNDQGWPKIITTLAHVESGEAESSEVCAPPTDMKGRNSNTQEFGATATYLRRYALATALGLVADDDTDAAIPKPPKQMPRAEVVNMDEIEKIRQEIRTLIRLTPDAFSKTESEIMAGVDAKIAAGDYNYICGALKAAREQSKAYAAKTADEVQSV